MGLMGSLTCQRFRVEGQLPEGWREAFRTQLTAFALKEPAKGLQSEEVEGWCRVQNLLHVDFDDYNTWLFGPYAVFALRVDKKALPARLLAATVAIQGEKWAAERGVERVPAAIRKEIRENIEQEWLARALPTVKTVEVAWNVVDGWAVIASHSTTMCDRIRKRFHRTFGTFGMTLVPLSPLDMVADTHQRTALLSVVPYHPARPGVSDVD